MDDLQKDLLRRTAQLEQMQEVGGVLLPPLFLILPSPPPISLSCSSAGAAPQVWPLPAGNPRQRGL